MSWFKRQKLIIKIALSGIVFCCLCVLPIAILNPSTQTILPTTIPPASQPTKTPEPTATPKEPALLPGLSPVDVTVSLEQRRLACNTDQGELYYTRTCKKEEAGASVIVVVYGRELFTVDLIETTVFQPIDPGTDLAASFLGFIATMPYDGATPEEARAWVESNVSAGIEAETTFAGARYRLSGPPSAITLEIGNLP